MKVYPNVDIYIQKSEITKRTSENAKKQPAENQNSTLDQNII